MTSSTRISTVVTALFAIVALGLGLYGFAWPNYQRAQLIKNGIQTDAQIMAIAPTGNIYNHQPEVRITLQVRPANARPYTTQTTMVINQVYLSQYQPGTRAHVRVDKNDPTRVVLEEILVP